MHVVLVHGMGRSPLALRGLGRRLRAAGHTTSSFAYWVRMQHLDAIATRFAREVRERTGGERFAVVGHSLGNVIYRLAESGLDSLPAHVVMLAPPNQPSAVARLVSRLPVGGAIFSAVTGDAGRRLISPEFYATLPAPRAPVTVFAGDRGPRLRIPFRGAPNDGLVSVDETRLVGASHEIVPAIHTFIMHDSRVVQRTLELCAKPSA